MSGSRLLEDGQLGGFHILKVLLCCLVALNSCLAKDVRGPEAWVSGGGWPLDEGPTLKRQHHQRLHRQQIRPRVTPEDNEISVDAALTEVQDSFRKLTSDIHHDDPGFELEYNPGNKNDEGDSKDDGRDEHSHRHEHFRSSRNNHGSQHNEEEQPNRELQWTDAHLRADEGLENEDHHPQVQHDGFQRHHRRHHHPPTHHLHHQNHIGHIAAEHVLLEDGEAWPEAFQEQKEKSEGDDDGSAQLQNTGNADVFGGGDGGLAWGEQEEEQHHHKEAKKEEDGNEHPFVHHGVSQAAIRWIGHQQQLLESEHGKAFISQVDATNIQTSPAQAQHEARYSHNAHHRRSQRDATGAMMMKKSSWPLLLGRGDVFLQHSSTREDGSWLHSTCSSALTFYGYLFCCAGVIFLIVKGLEVLKVVTPRRVVSEAMLRVAVYYSKWPRGAPIVATGALFAAADVVAQLSQDYWTASAGNSFWSVTTTLSVGATAALLHGGLVTHYYMRFEASALPVRDVTSGAFKVARLLVYYVCWLTVYALLFGIVAGLFYRLLWGATSNCAFSVVAGIPYNVKESTTYHLSNYVRTFTSSCIFWTPSHAANYWVSQRWSPNFRTSWDGGMALLWNLHVLRGSGGLMAVGPVLSGVAPSTASVLPSVDCNRWSLWACTSKIWDILLRIWGWIRWGLGKVWDLICKILSFTKSTLWWIWTHTSYWTRTLLYWLWYLVLWVFTIVRLALWLVLMAIWKALSLVFGILDVVKRMMFMGWIPDFFPYESCPYCFLYPGDESWPGRMSGSAPVMGS